MVNGSSYLATQNNSFPFWLDAGSTLSTNPPMNFISVIEYNENEAGDDTNLGYSKVLSITESSVVPDGKVWKVVSALKYHVEGCTDSNAENYDQDAMIDNGSCDYLGCTNALYLEYNEDATIDDGSCTVEVIYGCTNNFLEYNVNANVYDGSCFTSAVYGCTNQDYIEYDATANVDDGSCSIFIEIGAEAFGGIIFYLDQGGLSGLVASPLDAGTLGM